MEGTEIQQETKLRLRRKASSLPIPGNKMMGFLYNEILVDNQVAARTHIPIEETNANVK